MEESLNFNRTTRENKTEETAEKITSLERQKQTLEAEIKILKETKDRTTREPISHRKRGKY